MFFVPGRDWVVAIRIGIANLTIPSMDYDFPTLVLRNLRCRFYGFALGILQDRGLAIACSDDLPFAAGGWRDVLIFLHRFLLLSVDNRIRKDSPFKQKKRFGLFDF